MRPQKDSIKIIECYRFARIFGVYRVCPQLPRTAWLVTDICGLVCAVFTWLLVLYAEFVVNAVMIMPLQLTFYKCFNGILFNLLSFLAITSHLRAMLSDPGAVPKGNATKENIHKLGLKDGQVVYRCPKCVSIKPDRAHHCSVCRRCIKKMDHHCPWVNNCVGEGNQKYFVLFTMYIFLISFHALYMVVVHFITCVGSRWEACDSYSPPVQTVLTIFLTFESLLFGIFTAIMFGSQMQAICSDETGIESLKQEYMPYEKKSKWMNIKMVFGHPFSIYWFSPFHNAVNLGKLDSYHYTV